MLACSGPAKVATARRGDDGVYAAALAEWRAGRDEQAAAGFRDYLHDAPDGADAEAARYYLTIALVRLADCEAAREALAEMDPDSVLAEEARGPTAACQQGVGRLTLDEGETWEQLGRALAKRRDSDAVLYANRLAVLGATVDAETRAVIERRIDAAPIALLEDLWPLLEPQRWPAPRVAYRRVAVALHAGDLDRAERLLPAVADATWAAELRAALDDARALAQVDPDVIGVLLPLSGRYAKIGKELQIALELAAAEDKQVKLVFADTGGEEARATAAVDELVRKWHPLFLLGPVGEREAAAAAARAAQLGVPIGLFTPTEGLADPTAGVVRLWSSGEQRARAAAAIAVELGYDTFAVFAPADDSGRAQARAFTEAALAAGADVEVVKQEEYDPTGTDLEPDVKRLLDLDPARNERLRRHLAKHRKDGWKTFSPDVTFDLLFVPDGHERAALIAAYLVYFNVELRTGDDVDSAALKRKHRGRLPAFVQLLGGSGWHHPELSLRGGQAVEGAYVIDVFPGAGEQAFPGEQAARFAERFRRKTGRSPSSIAAEAFDGMLLALGARRTALAKGAKASRKAAAAALADASIPDGACGPARMGDDGELSRDVLLWRVEGGEFVLQDSTVVEESPEEPESEREPQAEPE